MKKTIQTLLILVGVICGVVLPAPAQQPVNLLTDASFDQGDGQNVPGWLFSTWNAADPSVTGKVDGKVNLDTDGHRYLSVAASQPLADIQMWWQTSPDLDCKPGGTYALSVSAKGGLKTGKAQLVVGFYFLDSAGKWVAFQEIKVDQDATLPADWKKLEGTITAPDNAAKIGVRLGVIFKNEQAEVFFKDPVLTLKSN